MQIASFSPQCFQKDSLWVFETGACGIRGKRYWNVILLILNLSACKNVNAMLHVLDWIILSYAYKLLSVIYLCFFEKSSLCFKPKFLYPFFVSVPFIYPFITWIECGLFKDYDVNITELIELDSGKTRKKIMMCLWNAMAIFFARKLWPWYLTLTLTLVLKKWLYPKE